MKILEWITASSRNFVIYGGIAFGVPIAGLFLYQFKQFNYGAGFTVFVVLAGILAGIVWGFLFWHIFVVPFKRRISRSMSREKS
jgi:ABC-type amino acid transport system permease subunit